MVAPGRHAVRFTNNDKYCEGESRAGLYTAMAIFGGGIGAVLVAIDQAQEKDAVTVEFDAAAGKSYVVDCDRDAVPWVRITPEDQR
jgi:hypothetical protein